jgi:ribosomal protein S18 acetylase RimI-like enzyme
LIDFGNRIIGQGHITMPSRRISALARYFAPASPGKIRAKPALRSGRRNRSRRCYVPFMNTQISKSNNNDLPIILNLQYLAYQSEAEIYNDFSIPPLTQTLSDLQEESKQSLILKAVIGNEIIGSVRAKQSQGTCEIGRLIVHPNHQGKGIGSKLLSEIESYYPQTTRFELFTGTKSEKNLKLYEKSGYHRFKEVEVSEGITFAFLEKTGNAT